MSFWEKTLGSAPAPAPRQEPVPQNRPWFMMDQPPTPQAAQPVQEELQVPKRLPASARRTDTCPDCGSSNFFKASVNSMEQCFECGSNPRFTQSTQGVGTFSSGDGQPVTPAKQVSVSNNFNPHNIVGRIE